MLIQILDLILVDLMYPEVVFRPNLDDCFPLVYSHTRLPSPYRLLDDVVSTFDYVLYYSTNLGLSSHLPYNSIQTLHSFLLHVRQSFPRPAHSGSTPRLLSPLS